MTIAIVDGDLIAFRCAASAEGEEEWVALARVDSFIENILTITGADKYEIWLSGHKNFRKTIYPEYKANRKSERPKHEKASKTYLQTHHGAQVLDEAEADDALGFRMYELQELEQRPICVTNDKDLKQTPGKHYDPVKQLFFDVSPEEARRFFYYQCLVGDPVDNIKGVPGLGKVKANKILDSVSPDEWEQTVKDQFSCEEEYLMNARCVYIWKKRNDRYELSTH